MRLGLCCTFAEQPIKFRTTTAAALKRLRPAERREKLGGLCRANAEALRWALEYCAAHGIGCFRVNSQILPVRTHPEVGYALDDLPDGAAIIAAFRACGEYAVAQNLRTSFHPDQFVVLSSPREAVVMSSLAEIEYQAEVAEWIGADVINVHGGGGYGDKPAALARLRRNLDRLSDRARSRLTLENDDIVYTPSDLLPVCREARLPLVYDVHHHRCLPDTLGETQAAQAAAETWNREPLFHVSSPLEGWRGPNPRRHRDFIDLRDFPADWQRMDLTVEVEAKAKERAVAKLKQALARRERRNAFKTSNIE